MSRTAVLELVTNGVVVRLNDHERTSTYVADLESATEIVRQYFDASTGTTSRITRPIPAVIEGQALEPKESAVSKSDCYHPHASKTLHRPSETEIPTKLVPVTSPDATDPSSIADARARARTVRWARPSMGDTTG
jgi:hypothetical protein